MIPRMEYDKRTKWRCVMTKRRSAQSILEYIIVLSAITAAVLAATAEGGPLRNAIDKMFNDSSQVIEDKSSLFLQNVGSNPN